MSWIVVICIAVFAFSAIDDWIELQKNKDPISQKKAREKAKEEAQNAKAFIARLEQAVGRVCILTSLEFAHIIGITKATGRILALDTEWVALELYQKRFFKIKTRRILLKISAIDNFAIKV